MSRSISSESDKDVLVKSELCKFILKNTGLDALDSVDEIVMNYLIGVLESLESASEPEDIFDVNEFAEMMSAYIPAFSSINIAQIYEWMLQLADFLKENSKKNGENCYTLEDIFFRNYEKCNAIGKNKNDKDVELKCQDMHPRRRSYCCSCNSSQSEDDDRCFNVTVEGMSTELDTLLEMFPNLHLIEAKQFLSIADGNCEQAVQLILQKQESDQQMTESVLTKNLLTAKMGGSKDKDEFEEKKLREQILKRYAYIDQDEDVREHKPLAPKMEPKKLIRYRDSKIVSLKGERYSDVNHVDSGDSK